MDPITSLLTEMNRQGLVAWPSAVLDVLYSEVMTRFRGQYAAGRVDADLVDRAIKILTDELVSAGVMAPA